MTSEFADEKQDSISDVEVSDRKSCFSRADWALV